MTGCEPRWPQTSANSYRKRNPNDRTGVRSHQTQPRVWPLSPKRASGGAHRVAATDGSTQPHQAPPPPNRHRRGLKGPTVTTTPDLAFASPQADTTAGPQAGSARTSVRQPRPAAVVTGAGGRTRALPDRGSGMPLAEARFRVPAASDQEHHSRACQPRRQRPAARFLCAASDHAPPKHSRAGARAGGRRGSSAAAVGDGWRWAKASASLATR